MAPPTSESGRRQVVTGVLSALVTTVGLTLGIAACTDDSGPGAAGFDTTPPDLAAPELRTASGGGATVDNTGANAFAQPSPGLTGQELRAFVVGNNFFNDNWVTAPASTTARDGLGPLFNAQSCSSCHFKDGRGAPPTAEDPEELGLLLRLSVPGEGEHGAPVPHPVYGGQLQDRAINDAPAEGTIEIDEREITGTFDDGTPYTLIDPRYSVADPAYGPLGDDTMISPRIAPPVFGAGLLEAVPDVALRELAEQQRDASERDSGAGGDEDGGSDGAVSGRLNMVWSPTAQAMAVGRFGWKANVATVEEQTAGAFHGDIGITSFLHPLQDCTVAQTACLDAPESGQPEITDDKLGRVVFYTRALAVPARRDVGEPVTDQGEQVFADLGCSACHVPELRTGDSDIEPLANQTIRPYTDLLLHDMGPGLADDRPDFGADGSEWRTAPLWGIGLTDEVNGHTRFLHDGRARDLSEAILWHGGEAQSARDGYLSSSKDERDALFAFLNSL
ncbi:MAG: di-heme oxidoredictase family protein [Microthrixaceae bacterium]